jgi:WD40 repeat protein/uncharacterized caspase-like protein
MRPAERGRASACALVACLYFFSSSSNAPAATAAGGPAPAATPVATPVTKPELSIQTGHSAAITAIAVSPDGRLVASGGVDEAVLIWDAATGVQLRALRGHGAAIQTLVFSPDGRVLASAGTDTSIVLWNVENGTVVRQLVGHAQTVRALAFSPDGKLLVSAGMDQTLKVWEVGSGRLMHTRITDEKPTYVGLVLLALSSDGRTIATGGEVVKLWDAISGNELRTLQARNPPGSPPDLAISFSPDGKSLAVSGRTVRVLDVATGALRWSVAPDSGIESLVYSPDGRTLVGSGVELVTWDAATGRELRRFEPGTDRFDAVVFSPDGRSLLAAGGSTRDYALRLFDAASGSELHSFAGRTSPVTSIAFSPDGRLLATGRRTNIARPDTVKLWDLAGGQMQRTLDGAKFRVREVAFSGDGRTLAAGGGITLDLWDAASGKALQHFNTNPRQVDALAFSSDGKVLATGDRNGSIRLSDAATGQKLFDLPGHARGVHALAFSPDGRLLASGGHDHLVRLWNTATGAQVRVLTAHSDDVSALAFSRDGRTLASSGVYQQVILWDVQAGTQLRTLPTFQGATSFRVDALAFSPDGKSLVAGVVPLLSAVGGALLWDLTSSAAPRRLPGATSIGSVAFSADGAIVAGGSDDSTIRLWDRSAGRQLATLVALDGDDWLVVTPDGLFDGSPAAWSQILWRFSPRLADVAPVEVFFNEFFHPGLLGEVMAGQRPRAAATIEAKDRRQPRVSIAMRTGAASARPAPAPAPAREPAAAPIAARRVKLAISIESAPAGAQELRLFRNGSLVQAWHGELLHGASHASFEAEIAIGAGENRLTAYAFNRDNVKSTDASLVLDGAASLRRAGTAFVLAVGVDHYANPQFDLGFAVADAKDFADEFQRQQQKLAHYGRVEVVPLFDRQATKADFLAALARIAAVAQPEDAVVVYFAGHGTAVEQRFYLIPHDLGFAGARDALGERDLATVLAHSVSDRELQAAFERVDAGRILTVIDACNSGQALEAREKRQGPMNSAGLAQLAYEKGMYVLTAAQSYQAALEPADLGHGLLTYALVEEGLKKSAADADPRDGTILLREWIDYAAERVPQIQRERMRQAQRRALKLAYREGEEKIDDAEARSVQRPRAFYRRELEAQPLVVLGP